MEFEEKVSLFLNGLARLSEETGIYVTGCGCCDSPDLCDLDERESEVPRKRQGLLGTARR